MDFWTARWSPQCHFGSIWLPCLSSTFFSLSLYPGFCEMRGMKSLTGYRALLLFRGTCTHIPVKSTPLH